MSAEVIGAIVITLFSGGFVIAIINHFLSPKTRAETRAIAQKAARDEIDSRIQGLRNEIADAVARADRAEDRAQKAEDRADKLSTRIDSLEAEIESAHEQNDLMGKQLLAREEEVKELRAQNRILIEHSRLVEEFSVRHFAAIGQPIPHDWPRLAPFD